uniref:F-box domain-containing protein n=1 Tax=Kalanchoe fedtschenkoi TaxID=63787 RepID=A0A7N0V7J9_KALFE
MADWSELTHECLTNVLARLSVSDRWLGAMFVCKPWLRACKDPSLNRSLDLGPWFDSPRESPLWWQPEFERRIDAMVRNVVKWGEGDVVEIRVRHCSDRSVAFVAERCPNLQVLSIKSSPHVSDASMEKVALSCRSLKELDISSCYEISHESLLLIGKSCPNLKTLRRNFVNWADSSEHARVVPKEYLDACPQDGNSEAAAIGKYMPGLEHLELKFSKLTAQGLIMISAGCTELQYLDLVGCLNLTSRDITNAMEKLNKLRKVEKPNFYIPRSVYHTERYGHWQLYDERFQTDVFRI